MQFLRPLKSPFVAEIARRLDAIPIDDDPVVRQVQRVQRRLCVLPATGRGDAVSDLFLAQVAELLDGAGKWTAFRHQFFVDGPVALLQLLSFALLSRSRSSSCRSAA